MNAEAAGIRWQRKSEWRAGRRGSLVAELIIAAIITGTVTLMVGPAVSAILRQQERRRFETLAYVELGNQQNSPGGDSVLSDWFLRRYPDATLSREAVPALDEVLPMTGAVRLTIQRPDVNGLPVQSVSVVFWPAGGRGSR